MMSYPQFYDNVESMTLYDPLSEVLGSFDKGLITFKYIQIVKASGHSCPTVAGAYLMTLSALKALYPESTPVRGQIDISFKEDLEDGVAGVISNVITHITGATDKSGFKGLNGKFARHSLMHFNSDIQASARFMRTDTKEAVDVFYDSSAVAPHPEQMTLMPKIMQNSATDEEKAHFAKLWQMRVEQILCEYEKHDTLIKVVSL
jgi:hypothetical protein